MKSSIVISIIVFCAMLTLPLHLLDSNTAVQTTATLPSLVGNAATDFKSYDEFRIKTENGIKTISRKDYIIGVVAAEMPALYEPEALKAQAVAAYSFAAYRASERALQEYDLTDNPELDQAYMTEAELKKRWGDNSEKYLKLISDAVSAVDGVMLCWENQPALSVYHAISSGVTASAKEVWGKDIPYLVETESLGDKLAATYLSTEKFTQKQIKSSLNKLGEAKGNCKNWFGKAEYSKSGRVASISFCGKKLTGSEVSKALGLRSASFEVEYKDDTFIFTVKGYGHGVGMSQNGANYMAKQGSDFKEILLHYYKGCEIV